MGGSLICPATFWVGGGFNQQKACFFFGGSLLEPRDSDSIADLLKSANAKWTFDDEEGQQVEKRWASVKYSPPRLSYNESSSKHAITVAAAIKRIPPSDSSTTLRARVAGGEFFGDPKP